MFVTAWVFEALNNPTLLNEIKKTKLDSNTEPQAGINILLNRSPFGESASIFTLPEI